MTLLQMKNVKEITVVYEDGTIEIFVPPEGAAFYRESYTFKQAEGSARVEAVLDCHEIFWAVTTTPEKAAFRLKETNARST